MTHHSPEERRSHRGPQMPIFSWIRDCWALVKLGAPILDIGYLIKGVAGGAWLRDPENVVHPRAGSYLPRVGYELCNLAGGLFLQFLCL